MVAGSLPKIFTERKVKLARLPIYFERAVVQFSQIHVISKFLPEAWHCHKKFMSSKGRGFTAIFDSQTEKVKKLKVQNQPKLIFVDQAHSK